MGKQDWTPRASSVWILSLEWSDDHRLFVFLSEQAAQKAMVRMMKHSLKEPDVLPQEAVEILSLLEDKNYTAAADLWEERFRETYSWEQYTIQRET